MPFFLRLGPIGIIGKTYLRDLLEIPKRGSAEKANTQDPK